MFAEYELMHVQSSLKPSDVDSFKFTEELKIKSFVGELREIRKKLRRLENDIQPRGWKIKKLPLEQ